MRESRHGRSQSRRSARLDRLNNEDTGSVLLETALGTSIVLAIAVPFASLVSYAAHATQDVVAVHSAVRTTSHTKTLPTGTDLTFTCGATVAAADACPSTLARPSYVRASKDTTVTMPFGLTLHTNARAVGRVG